jgi:5-methylcytosine-specific restriction endonuclease McrBC regulatory subunit McrC
MSQTRVIRVQERGQLEVSGPLWTELARSSTLWKLVDQGVLRVEARGRGRARLIGGCYVGRARISDDVVLEMHEKTPGSLAALLRYTSGLDFNIKEAPSPSTDLGDLVGLLIASFIDAVRRYASNGRQFQYKQIPQTGSLIGGRLQVTRTCYLRARGLKHLACFDRSVISYATSVNRSLLAALREIEKVSKLVQLSTDLVARARSMAMVFDDCRDADVLFGMRESAAATALALAGSTSDRKIADMLSLAAIILSHESFENDVPIQGTSPRSWFLNLETLFERALRSVANESMRDTGDVVSGRSAPQPIFVESPEMFKANPDFVVRIAGFGCAAIGDAKYKLWHELPSASDLYQLLVHGRAYSTNEVFFIYPNETFEVRHLGTSVTGARVRLYAIDVRVMKEHVALVLSDLTAVKKGCIATLPSPAAV